MTSGRPPARPFDIAHLDLQLIEDRTLDYLKDKQPTCEHGEWRFADWIKADRLVRGLEHVQLHAEPHHPGEARLRPRTSASRSTGGVSRASSSRTR
jgi:hypothetical protein